MTSFAAEAVPVHDILYTSFRDRLEAEKRAADEALEEIDFELGTSLWSAMANIRRNQILGTPTLMMRTIDDNSVQRVDQLADR
jgi:hypothetical protein